MTKRPPQRDRSRARWFPFGSPGIYPKWLFALVTRLGGWGRAILVMLLWTALCIGLILVGAAIDISQTGAGFDQVLGIGLGIVGLLLFILGPWIAEAWLKRSR